MCLKRGINEHEAWYFTVKSIVRFSSISVGCTILCPLIRWFSMSFSSKELKKLLLRRPPSWNSFLKAKERSPGWEKDLRIGLLPCSPFPTGWSTDRNLSVRENPPTGFVVSEFWETGSNSAFLLQLMWLNFSMHSSIRAGGAFLWATVTRPQKSTSNFLANVSSNSDGQWSSSWRAIFPACRMELMISGTCGERQACYLEHAVIWLPRWHTGHKYLGSWHQALPVSSTVHSVSGPLKEDPRRNLRFPWECLPWEGKLQHSQRRKGNNIIKCYAPLRCQELS